MERFFLAVSQEFQGPFDLDRQRVDELVKVARLRRLGVFFLEGGCMTDQMELFQEFKEKIHFPEYFGSNWNSLDERLADLDWLEYPGYLVVIEASDAVLCKEEEGVREMFGGLLRDISQEWANADPPVAYRTIMVVDG